MRPTFKTVKPKFLLSLCFFCGLVACGGGGGGSESGAGVETAESAIVTGERANACGTVVDGELRNPVSLEDGTFYQHVSVVAPNVVGLDSASGPLLVKLLALDSTVDARADLSMQKLASLVADGAYFFTPRSTCTTTTATGGVGVSGQLITPAGLDVGEEMVKAGFGGTLQSTGSCGEDLVSGCYASLQEQFAPKNAGLITEFLWKPSSDGEFAPGKLAVLINTDPCDVIIVANGEVLQNYGPSNGRCMTARSLTRSGCEFGANAKVEILNRETHLPYVFPDGQLFIINPDGCERLQFKL
ncbi:MAG: hypothetical protein U0136_12775 [Bdellovibrionota bacterium]